MRIIIDWPFPVSMNAIWRGSGRRVYNSKRYVDWKKAASLEWMVQKSRSEVKNIPGKFSLLIILNPPDNRRRDLDNYAKVQLDLLQHLGIIKGDHLCRKLTIEYGTSEDAPLGSRLILRAV